MIVGIGPDLIEIARIGKACEKQAFLSRIYTEEECRLAGGSILRLAGNFAVKEAVSKLWELDSGHLCRWILRFCGMNLGNLM